LSIKKKLSDEDIKYWLALTKTLDSKKYNHLKKQNFCDANETYFHKKLDLEKNLIFKKVKAIKKIDEKKYFRDVIPEDIRIDKKKLNLLKRGKLQPEFILDLHGMNTVIAKKKSIEFIKANYLNGKRLLLIITGKGKSSRTSFFENGNQIGIIRKSLKAWLYDSDMRTKILGVVSSHIIHGGEGAFYIYLKKNKNL
jgi:DNA-nicking Smr family endonuclease